MRQTARHDAHAARFLPSCRFPVVQGLCPPPEPHLLSDRETPERAIPRSRAPARCITCKVFRNTLTGQSAASRCGSKWSWAEMSSSRCKCHALPANVGSNQCLYKGTTGFVVKHTCVRSNNCKRRRCLKHCGSTRLSTSKLFLLVSSCAFGGHGLLQPRGDRSAARGGSLHRLDRRASCPWWAC